MSGTRQGRRRLRFMRSGRAEVVPDVALWSSEVTNLLDLVGELTFRTGPLSFVDPREDDWDERGVLWERMPESQGAGEPNFGAVHGRRHRLAMTRGLCQVCGELASETDTGRLYLAPSVEPKDWAAGELVTGHAPLCVPCAWLSVRVCPHLRSGHVAFRARGTEPYGVEGTLFQGALWGPKARDVASVAYGDRHTWRVLAYQMYVRLSGLTAVDLKEEARALHEG